MCVCVYVCTGIPLRESHSRAQFVHTRSPTHAHCCSNANRQMHSHELAHDLHCILFTITFFMLTIMFWQHRSGGRIVTGLSVLPAPVSNDVLLYVVFCVCGVCVCEFVCFLKEEKGAKTLWVKLRCVSELFLLVFVCICAQAYWRARMLIVCICKYWSSIYSPSLFKPLVCSCACIYFSRCVLCMRCVRICVRAARVYARLHVCACALACLCFIYNEVQLIHRLFCLTIFVCSSFFFST